MSTPGRPTVSTHAPLRQRGELGIRSRSGWLLSVSTHAPLRQRGEHGPIHSHALRVLFQPTPRFVSEANPPPPPPNPVTGFVSTHAPLRQRGELQPGHLVNPHRAVSTHAPLRQRGELSSDLEQLPLAGFQPTPRFVSEANPCAPPRLRGSCRFNPRPASSARRTASVVCGPSRDRAFQPTPRFVSEANGPRGKIESFHNGFNPRPASSARRTRW